MATTRKRRSPDREGTERALMESALRLLERDGVLAGLNMQEVADLAGVNRGLIHHYFRTRQALLRAAIDREIDDARADYESHRGSSLDEKGGYGFNLYVGDPRYSRLVALLALDGDDGLEPLPFAAEREEDIRREVEEGAWADDVDPVAVLVTWESVMTGYVLMREALSRQLGIPLRQLDRRVRATIGRQMSALRPPPPPDEPDNPDSHRRDGR